MAFNPEEVSRLLAECHRRCCICHRFCGVKMETDHIEQQADSGNDSIGNAIPVCFECHAEIHLYNDRHPKGRKFQPEEVREHKKQWLKMCKERPEMFIMPLRKSDVGPLNALVDELKFNKEIKVNSGLGEIGCRFETRQFDRVISEGYLSMLHDDLANCLMTTYRDIKKANAVFGAWMHATCGQYYNKWQTQFFIAVKAVNIDICYTLLEGYLKYGEGK